MFICFENYINFIKIKEKDDDQTKYYYVNL